MKDINIFSLGIWGKDTNFEIILQVTRWSTAEKKVLGHKPEYWTTKKMQPDLTLDEMDTIEDPSNCNWDSFVWTKVNSDTSYYLWHK